MYVQRTITSEFRKMDELYRLIALVGARQSGKTTFLKHHMGEENASYVLFDDPDARKLFNQDIKKFEFQYLEGSDLSVLDEAQYCTDAGSKLKYLVDTGRRMWVTSSSEVILRKEILSYLVGRVSVLRLFPFSIHEFLDAKEIKAYTDEMLERNIWEHMTYGGYPHVVLSREPGQKVSILQNLNETMLLKDVAQVFSIQDLGSLQMLIHYLATTPGMYVKYDSLANDLNISFVTVKKYLEALEASYFISIVRPFHTNKIKEITKQPRVYFIDTGVRNSILKRFEAVPDGRIFENYVFSELLKMGFQPRYWRTKGKAEVDFVIEMDNMPIPIEVKIHSNPGKIGMGLKSFIEIYEPGIAFIVSLDRPFMGPEGGCAVNQCDVLFTDIMGLWKHLGKRDFEAALRC